MKPLILYHRDLDGFVAALSYYLLLRDEAEYLSVQYGEDPPDVAGRYVAIVDFAYSREVIERMWEETEGNLLVLDHHSSSADALAGLHYCQINTAKSGAFLAYEHMLVELKSRAELRTGGITHPLVFKLEKLARYVDDNDRYAHKLQDTKEVYLALNSYPMDFEFWRTNILTRNLSEFVEEGRHIRRYRDQIVASLSEHTRKGTLDGHPCLVVNAPYFQSEIGHTVCTDDATVAVLWFQADDGKYVYSLRSSDDGPDVRTIAVVHGGGGHVHAAGFSDDDPPNEVIDFA